MFQSNEPAKPSGPPCPICRDGASIDTWGVMLCEACAVEWAWSEECKQVQKELDPIPLWRLSRMRDAGEKLPPEKTEEERRLAFRKAVSAWMARSAKRGAA